MAENDKLANAILPELVKRRSSACESWRVFGIMSEFVDATDRLSTLRRAVSIFGIAQRRPDHPYYPLAKAIAR